MQHLRETPLFCNAPAEVFASLPGPSCVYGFPPSVRLVEQGTHPDNLFVLLDGQVLIQFSEKHVTSTVFAGWPEILIGLSAILTNSPSPTSAVTTTHARLAVIPREIAAAAILNHPEMMRAALECISRFSIRLTQELHNRTFQTSVERLASWLIRHAQSDGDRHFVSLPFSKTQLASILGMSIESLSQSWKFLETLGVEVHKDVILWTEHGLLEQFASVSPEAMPRLS